MARFTALVAFTVAVGCAPKASSLGSANVEPPPESTAPVAAGADSGSGSNSRSPSVGNDPRVSTSAGTAGGVVVLWPRIVPAGEVDRSAALARRVQSHARTLAEQALPGRALDIRPAPERTCPRAGCEAVALGSLIIRDGEACALIAFVMPPGTDRPTSLVPWSGRVSLAKTEIPFRDYPESQVKVHDFARCEELLDGIATTDAHVTQALQSAP